MIARSFEFEERGLFLGTAALFALALTFGGLGPHAPFFCGLIEAAAFPLLVAAALFGRRQALARIDGLLALGFILLLLAIGLCQLVPIAPDAWRSLPGRDVPLMVLETLGVSDRARPLSLAPEDTRLVVQSWLSPIAIFLATVMATREERVRLGGLAIAVAALGSVVGLLQLSFGDGTFFLDPGGISDRYPGLFANYNHQAVFLAGAVALLPAVAAPTLARRGAWAWAAAGFWVLALFGALITSSRAGLALFIGSSAIAAARMLVRDRSGSAAPRGDRRPALLMLAIGVVLIAAVGWLAVRGYRAEVMSSRLDTVGADARYEFWSTTIEAIRAYSPYGTGFGTFEPVYQVTEPLEHVRGYVVNHAHNDYLEVVLEAGAAGVLLIALFTLWFGSRLVALVRRRGDRDPLALSGATIVALVMLHSLVDYPLRTEAIGCLFAFACALLIRAPGDGQRTGTRLCASTPERIAA